MYKKHHEVVAAVILKNNKIFCCQRGNKGECAYKWEFPGGKIESGETKEEAIVREIKEELNCIIEVKDYITTIEHEYNTFSLTMHIFLCTLREGEPILSEHINSSWCTFEALNQLDFAEADKKAIIKIEKLIIAKQDIKDIDSVLNDKTNFHKTSIDVFYNLSRKLDYIKYLNLLKVKNNLSGNCSFENLRYVTKVQVLKLLKESIKMYIAEEICKSVIK